MCLCRLLPGVFPKAELLRVFEVIDTDKSGTMDYHEFLRGFRVRIRSKAGMEGTDDTNEGFEKLVLDRVCAVGLLLAAAVTQVYSLCARLHFRFMIYSCWERCTVSTKSFNRCLLHWTCGAGA